MFLRRNNITRILASIAILISAMPRTASAQHYVFAHYMVTNQDYSGSTSNSAKVAAYETEIQQAQAVGIDGFALNCGGWSESGQTYYQTYVSQMFQAANALNSGFKLFFSADLAPGIITPSDIINMMQTYASNANYFVYNGQPVLSTFAGDSNSPSWWQSNVLNPLRSDGINVYFNPAFFPGGDLPTASQVQSGVAEWNGTVNGLFYWGIAGVPVYGDPNSMFPSSDAYATYLHADGLNYMAPVSAQYFGSNANVDYEYEGGIGFRNQWMDIINNSHPNWVEMITWNDFVEGTYVSPIDDPNKYTNANYLPVTYTGYYHSHYAFTDLLKFYIPWYKNGSQPAITQDGVYWFYRTQSMNYNSPNGPSVANRYGPLADDIYITCNLTAAATLKVNVGGNVTSINVPAGSNDYTVPFTTNETPSFQLVSGSTTIASASGADPIQSAPTNNNYYYSTGDMFGTAPGGGGSGIIANGLYSLTPECALAETLDDYGGYTNNGNGQVLWGASSGDKAQQWNFSVLSGSTTNYNLAVNLGPYCLDDSGGGGTTATQVSIYACNGGANQNWSASLISPDNAYSFYNMGDGECLDVGAAGTANQTKVDTWACLGNTAQKWFLNYTPPSIANGVHFLSPASASGYSLDNYGGSTANGNVQKLYTTGSSDVAEKYTFANVGGSSYNMAVQGPYCLDDDGGPSTGGTAAVIWSCNGGANQKWTATPIYNQAWGGVGYTFMAANADCLDVKGGGGSNGTVVDTWPCTVGDNAQFWTLH